LLSKWLVKYKFKTWTQHHATGAAVTPVEKEKRAEEIADKLSDNHIWKSHSKPLNIDSLENLKLKINDFGTDQTLTTLFRSYHQLMIDFIDKNSIMLFVHTRSFI
jgi:hypothetical protein